MGEYALITASFFKNMAGSNFILTPGQEEIFRTIYEPDIERATIRAITQYGKSEIAAMAVIIAAVERTEKILIISPSLKQSSIIMGKVIDHLFDNLFLTEMLEYTGSRLEQLRQERSKARLTLKNRSEIMMLTAEAKTVVREAKGLMGFGATMVIVDESSLIDDLMFSKILRMVGGGEGRKLVQLGNPFEDNHFGRAFRSPRYEKVIIKWQQALAEGRITQEFLDEAREEMPLMDWKIFYECEFPEMGAEDSLIPKNWLDDAVNQLGCSGEHKQAGLDVARFGSDKTVYIFRQGGEVKRIETIGKMDTMEVVGWVRGFLEKDNPDVLAVDVIGIGSGVYDRLMELSDAGTLKNQEGNLLGTEMEPVNVGEAPTDEEMKGKFFNLRAQISWNLRDLFKPDKTGQSQISIPDDGELRRQLGEIRYKYSSERKIKIEAKEEMKKRLGVSPDKADALALAFFDTTEMEPEMVISEV